MKVRIGNYVNRWTCDWHSDYMNKKYDYCCPDQNTNIWEHFLEKAEDVMQWIYNHTINLYLDKKKQTIKVHIDPWDTWSMDYTLAHVVLPMLKQLRAENHGAGYVDLEDVPEELRATPEEIKKYDENGSTDDNFFKRWDWIMDEMIYAFESKVDDSWKQDLFRGDIEAYDAKRERIANGFRLFGKYYEGLWD